MRNEFALPYSAAEAFPERALISLKDPKSNDSEPPKDFFFDAVFGPNVEQKYIYDVCASSVIESVLNGYNGTIFAYGQTGSGKVSLSFFFVCLVDLLMSCIIINS